MTTISANIIACNEESRLRWCIENLRFLVDEIVVVVQQSSDRTLEVACELADVVIEHPCYLFAEPSRPDGLLACRGDWIVVLDCAERLSDYGKAHLQEWVESNRADVYKLRRLTLVDDKQLEDLPHPRLFRRGFVTAPTTIHTMYEATGSARVA